MSLKNWLYVFNNSLNKDFINTWGFILFGLNAE